MFFNLVLATFVVQSFAAVVHLTEDTFAGAVDGSTAALVEFYAPWCGHCKNLAPEWAIAGDTFTESDGVTIAAVDATAAPGLASKFGVQGYPTIKFFPKGGDLTKPEEYDGGRTAEDIVNWVNAKVGTRRVVKKAPEAVVTLTTETFDAVALNPDTNAVVEFYAPWCGHCKNLAPHYEKLAQAFAGEKDVVVAKVDATEHGELADRYGVQGYPTLKFFGKGDKTADPTDFNGRELEEMVQLLNEKANTHRKADGSLEEQAGRLAELDMMIEEAKEVTEKLVEDLKAVAASLDGAAKVHGEQYVNVAKKIVAKGKGYVDTERRRLTSMLTGDSVNALKKTAFMVKRNILNAFE